METEEIVDQLSALAHRTRLAAFRMLAAAGEEGVAAGEIARRLGVPATTMSAHLAILSNAGLIQSRRTARTICYSVLPEGVRGLLGYLAADCCGGRPELCAPVITGASPCGPSPGRVRSPRDPAASPRRA